MIAVQAHASERTRRDHTAATVFAAVRDVCAMNGVTDLDISEDTVPFGIEDFDSITSVEVVVQISTKLGIRLANNPFLPRTDTPAQSLRDVINTIHANTQRGAQQ